MLKKKINLKELVTMYKDMCRADDDYNYKYKRLCQSGGHPCVEVYRQEYEDAKALYNEKLQGFRMACNDKIGPVLTEVQGKATARTIEAWEIVEEACDIFNRLGVSKKNMDGVKASVDKNAQSFPRAYKYEPMSTVFDIEYGKSATPFITNISRIRCRTYEYSIQLTDAAKEEIIRSAERLYR